VKLRKTLLTFSFFVFCIFTSPFLAKAAHFQLASPNKLNESGVWPVTFNLTNPNPNVNKGIVGVRLKVLFDQRLSLKEEDVISELPQPWTYVRKTIGPGEITIEAIYVKAGQTADVTPSEKFVTLNFHSNKPGKAMVRIDPQATQILAKANNENLLDSKIPAQAELNSESKAGFVSALSELFRSIFAIFKIKR
jgi:hypothetical protein